MANAQLQKDGQTSENGEKHNEKMTEDVDNDMAIDGYIVESMVINPLAFTFCQIAQSRTEIAMGKLIHL